MAVPPGRNCLTLLLSPPRHYFDEDFARRSVDSFTSVGFFLAVESSISWASVRVMRGFDPFQSVIVVSGGPGRESGAGVRPPAGVRESPSVLGRSGSL
ncbi:MAG: hypothetical protein ACOVT5_07930 [Armatimonadaceae bacterium]